MVYCQMVSSGVSCIEMVVEMKFYSGGVHELTVVGRNGRGGVIILPGNTLTSRGDGKLDQRRRKVLTKFVALERVNANEEKVIEVRML